MATELTRTFDTVHGCIVVQIKDAVFGNVSSHTVYVSMVPDVNAAIDQIKTTVDADAQVIYSKMIAAGWVSGS